MHGFYLIKCMTYSHAKRFTVAQLQQISKIFVNYCGWYRMFSKLAVLCQIFYDLHYSLGQKSSEMGYRVNSCKLHGAVYEIFPIYCSGDSIIFRNFLYLQF